MSFPRHEEIYRPIQRANTLGRPTGGHPSAHRYDEFPAGYSLAGCAPAEPASASPAGAHGAAQTRGSTMEKQRTANTLLTVCLTERDNRKSLFLFMESNRREIPRFARNDKINYFFRSLFSLWVLVLARTNPRRLKPAPLPIEKSRFQLCYSPQLFFNRRGHR
jgi:hypothetical protein